MEITRNKCSKSEFHTYITQHTLCPIFIGVNIQSLSPNLICRADKNVLFYMKTNFNKDNHAKYIILHRVRRNFSLCFLKYEPYRKMLRMEVMNLLRSNSLYYGGSLIYVNKKLDCPDT
jgi:hypothetical protein